MSVKKLSAAEELEQLPLPTKVCGLVLDRVDEMMHGETLGTANFQQQVAAWGEAGYLKQLVGGLHGRGFEVFLTSDHGDLGCVGRGKVTEGVLVETKGERARIYENEFLRDAALAKVPHAKAWPQVGLPMEQAARCVRGDAEGRGALRGRVCACRASVLEGLMLKRRRGRRRDDCWCCVRRRGGDGTIW